MRHLERDVNFHSRLTYGAQDGKILSVTTCEDGRSVASASSNGSIHVWRVQYVQHTRRGARDEYSGRDDYSLKLHVLSCKCCGSA